jgi:hypothetical protein
MLFRLHQKEYRFGKVLTLDRMIPPRKARFTFGSHSDQVDAIMGGRRVAIPALIGYRMSSDRDDDPREANEEGPLVPIPMCVTIAVPPPVLRGNLPSVDRRRKYQRHLAVCSIWGCAQLCCMYCNFGEGLPINRDRSFLVIDTFFF